MVDYNSSNIKQLSHVDHIRLRPASYIGNNGASGQRILVKEIVDNSIDELEECRGEGSVTMVLFRDLENSSYQVAVTDTGRGIPPGSLIDVFTKAMMGGKFDQNSYSFSAGLNGVGSTVVMALSSYFRAFSFRDGKIFDSGILNHTDDEDKRIIRNYSCPEDDKHGTTVIYVPDPDILNEITEFMDEPEIIVDYFAKMGLFIKFDLKLIIVDKLVPKKILTAEGPVISGYLDKIFVSDGIFDNRTFNEKTYLRKKFGVKDNFEYGIGVNYRNGNGTLLLDGSINITFDPLKTNSVCSINNIVFTDTESYHYTLIQNYLRKNLKIRIEDIKIRRFFEKKYVVPIWVYLNIKFSGAVFSGMEKSFFKDTNFRAPYYEALATILTDNVLDELLDSIQPHLNEAYIRFFSKEMKVSDSGILSSLNNPLSFNDCGTNDASNSELFIIEGLSAREKQARDPEYQAFYAIRGKMFNAVDTYKPEDLIKSREALVKDPLYSDIIKILNLGPNLTTDNLRFESIFLMADADIHGFHIANILISNLYIICPELITDGHMYVVKAPLYKINVGKKAPQMFARDYDDLLVGLANRLFYHVLEITLEIDGRRKVLNKEELLGFVGWVYQIGDFITSVSREYFVEPIILEQLALVIDKLDDPDPEEMSKILKVPVQYDKETDILSCSIGVKDIYVPLAGLREIIKTDIRPALSEFIDRGIQPLVTTKKNNSLKNTPLSIIQLYEGFKKLQSSLTINKMKGLGQMSKSEKIATCMNREQRRAHQITEIGDLDAIFNLMGKNSKHRKALLE